MERINGRTGEAHSSSRAPARDPLILMGVVGKPHGVRGLVHVHSYAADPTSLTKYRLTDESGKSWTLAWRGDGVAELSDGSGCPLGSRTEAERLVNTRLYVERSRLPQPDDDEFYLADLVGLEALDADGKSIGQVAAVHDYGGGTSLEIDRPGGAPLLVPFTRAAVPHIDVPAGCLTVIPPDEIVVREVAA